jgi:hypothetical protein
MHDLTIRSEHVGRKFLSDVTIGSGAPIVLNGSGNIFMVSNLVQNQSPDLDYF